MGRKRAKKGKGAEKTALKTEKKATKRIRSALESRGEVMLLLDWLQRCIC